MQHFVQVGVHGQVGRFQAADAVRYTRGDRVVVRTDRGLEIGRVLSTVDSPGGQPDGSLLRRMSDQDNLLAQRLEKNRDEAYESCVALLVEHGLHAVLMDVELLFDGKSLYFHFLGEPPAEVERLTEQLAQAYEAKAQVARFAETLSEGCGPGCGTEAAKGQGGCDSCAGCSIAAACNK